MQSKNNKNRIQQELEKSVKSFMNNEAEKAFVSLDNLEKMGIPKNERGNVQKVTLLLLAGTFYGIHTLKELLELYGVKKTRCTKIWRQLSHKQVYDLFVQGSRQVFQTAFEKLLKQSAASQSRATMTIVGDDSIFQHWLKSAENDPFYGKFFSGQFQKAVFGYCVSLVGVVLGDTFYPLTFSLVTKKEVKKGEKKESLVVIEKGIKEVVSFLEAIAERIKVELPTLYISLDNGFNDTELFNKCAELGLIPLFIPTKSGIIEFENTRMSFAELINLQFLPQEKAFFADEKNKNKHFLLRLRVFYNKMNRFVTIIIFRFNKSSKVTIVFTDNKDIKAKTMRWHFFQRTQIEQFFRLVKHTLQIRQSKSDDFKSFNKKLALFFLKALFAFTFRNFCRKHFKRFRTFSFYKLRINIIHHNVDKAILGDFIF